MKTFLSIYLIRITKIIFYAITFILFNQLVL